MSQPDHDFPFAVPPLRYDQRNELFKRRTWDETIRLHAGRLYSEVVYQDRPGYRKLDYALRNAAWHLEYGFAGGNMRGNDGLYSWDFLADKARRFAVHGPPVSSNPAENAANVKRAARFLGADLAGICHAHPHLIYSHEMDLVEMKHHPVELPDGCTHAVVLAVAMDYETTRYSPDAIAGASTGLGYSRQAAAANLLAAFIRGLGFRAIPCGNDTALSIPLAMAAGLGEPGRNGLLVTAPYGPRVRLAKVFTDLPLAHDTYRPFGVKEFCRTCRQCARLCPSQAIPAGEPTLRGRSSSNHHGVRRWYIEPEKCFLFWTRNRMDCNHCIMVCPFNKPAGRCHDAARWLIRQAPGLNGALVRLDRWLGYGRRRPAGTDFWKS